MVLSKLFVLGLFALSSMSLYAQSKTTFFLLDIETEQEIPSVYYQYGSKKGYSDSDGRISLDLKTNLVLILTHVSYGKTEITFQELEKNESGRIFLKEQQLDFHPVTVIALREQTRITEQMPITYEDKMSHDAGVLLTQNVAINGIRKSAAYGIDPVIRGFKYDQLNVVIDGVQSATAACPNRMDPPTSQIASNMAQRIEVLKGPHSLRYGVGLGATINVKSIKPQYSPNLSSIGRISSGYEANGNISRYEALAGFTSQKVSVSFLGSWSEGNDYTAGNGDVIASNFLRASFGSKMGYIINDYQDIELDITYNRAEDAEFPALPMDLRKDETWLFKAKHQWDINNGLLNHLQTSFYGSFVDHLMDNKLRDLNPRMMNASTPAISRTLGGRSELTMYWDNHQMYLGLDSKYQNTEGVREREFLMGPMAGNILYDNAWQKAQIINSGLFSEFNTIFEKDVLTLAARLDLNIATVNDPSNEFLSIYNSTNVTQMNPSLSVGWKHDFNSKLQSSIWLARVQRSASLTERYINFFPVGFDPYELVGNPSLQPEINNQMDMSLVFQSGSHTIQTDAYVSYLQNAITSYIDTTLSPRIQNSPGVRQFTSISSAFKTGFELSWSHLLWSRFSQGIDIAFTYGQDLELNEPLPEIAPLDIRYHLTTSWLKNKFQTFVQIRYVSEQNRVSNEFGELESPSFLLVDGNLSYQFPLNVKFKTGVNNLFNKNYFEHLNRVNRQGSVPIYAPGRNVYFSLSLSF